MVFRTTPQLGPQLDYNGGLPWYDSNNITEISPRLGTKEVGNDGHDYLLLKASAAISAASAPGTQIAITEPAMTAAAGSGGWYAPIGGVLINQYFWARKGAAGVI